MSLLVQFVRLKEIEEEGGGILVYIRRMQWENKHSHSQKKLQKSSRPLIKYGKDISQTSREWVSKVFPSCFTVCDTDL